VNVVNPLAGVDDRVAEEVRRVVAGRWRDARIEVVSRARVEVLLPNP
jgi:transcriptional regulator of nitric oxide reductase